jgi:hypothetical protein
VTATGYAPTPKYGVANGITHAYQILSQNAAYDPAVHFLKVTDPKWVWTTADFYFSSHPFGWLRTNAALLKHAASIRNRVAHDSEKCKASFRETALLFLNPANGKLTKGFSAGTLLLKPVTHQFPQAMVHQGPSHFDAYADLFDQAATAIVP